MIHPVSFVPVTASDLDTKADPSLGSLNAKLRPLYQLANDLSGANGPITLLNSLNMNNNPVRNIGAPVTSADALNQTNADPMYSTSTQQAAMEAVGNKMLQTTRRLNDGTQQHVISSDLNKQGSIPPSNVNGMLAYNSTGTQVVFTWTGIYVQLSDGSYATIKNSSLTVTGLASGMNYYYPYYDTKLGLLVFVVNSSVASGAPPVAFPSVNSAAGQAQNSDGRIALTSAGYSITTGGGSGTIPLRARS
jgi:hypothetical protein